MKSGMIEKEKGFTLGQMVTTVAIIGAVTAIAVPNYLRMRMNANMEMVKQQLKVIGEEMTELMGKTGKFVNQTVWGNDPSELGQEITANLNGISNKGYTTNQYSTDLNRSWYQFRTCPQAGKWGVSGDKCFLLESTGVKEVALWEGWYPGDSVQVAGCSISGCARLFYPTDPLQPTEEAAEAFFLRMAALSKTWYDQLVQSGCGPLCEGKDPAYRVLFNNEAIQGWAQYLSNPIFYQRLAEKGVEVGYFPPGTYNINIVGDTTIFAFHLDPSFDPSAYLSGMNMSPEEGPWVGY